MLVSLAGLVSFRVKKGSWRKKRKEKVESDGVQHRTTTSGLYTLIHICGNTHIHAGRNTQ